MAEDTQRVVVGDATITALVEAETPGIPAGLFFPEIGTDEIRSTTWLADAPGAADPSGTVTLRVQAFVVEHAGRVTLVDPCVGNGKVRGLPFWNDLALPWLDRFHAAGFREDAIDMVVHTHLHEDHVGWDTHRVDGEWRPTFVNARHVYVDAELDWACTPGAERSCYADSILPILDAGLADVVAPGADLGAGMRLVSTPGHTPGHTSVFLDCGESGAILSGDFLHHQVQLRHPELAEIGDEDAVLARQTRYAFLDHCAQSGALFAGTHFPVAPFGRVVADGATWRFEIE